MRAMSMDTMRRIAARVNTVKLWRANVPQRVRQKRLNAKEVLRRPSDTHAVNPMPYTNARANVVSRKLEKLPRITKMSYELSNLPNDIVSNRFALLPDGGVEENRGVIS